MKIAKLALCALVALPVVAMADVPNDVGFNWVKSSNQQPLPQFAVQGGHENDGTPLYLCKAKHNGGVQPGKIVNGNCNIGWGGVEVVKPKFEVLISQDPDALGWVRANDGYVPENAVQGGHETDGTPLYICKTRYMGGVHPGKIVGGNCNISFGGDEIPISSYKVLVS